MNIRTVQKVIGSSILLLCFSATFAEGTPLFARRYDVSCQTCHAMPPRLNAQGEEFVARGYRFPEPMRPSETVPAAFWMSLLGQKQPGRDFLRGFPNRLEIIASDATDVLGISYFVEWRALSMELQSNGTFRDRSGRFEDLFVSANVTGNVAVTLGQFRLLSQVDVSRRLSVSEPFVFASGIAGKRASTPRLTSLRSFSPSGRSPTLRVQHRVPLFSNNREADGWFTIVNVPMTGELSLPLTTESRRNASFEFEAAPKGIFVETFARSGLNSLGIHAFAGNNERMLAQLVGASGLSDLFLTAAFGVSRVQTRRFTNMMLEAEYIPTHFTAVAVRFEHQVGDGRKPAVIPYAVVHFPGTSYTLRLALEHRVQHGNDQTLIETSLIF